MTASVYARARAAWPTIHVDPDTFGRHVAERLRPGESHAALHLEDLYIACACAQGAAPALDAFERHYLSAVQRQLARIDRSDPFVDEVKQRLRHRLLVRDHRPPRIASYSGRGPLASFVHVAAVRIALDLRRELCERPLRDGEACFFADDPERALLRGGCGAELRRAFVAAVATLRPRDRGLLRRHFLDGVPQRSIARSDGIAQTYVSRRLKIVRQRLRDETQRRLGISDGDEVMRLMHEELAELDVRKLFSATRARPRVFQAGR